jgi:YD repeat-containing protein
MPDALEATPLLGHELPLLKHVEDWMKRSAFKCAFACLGILLLAGSYSPFAHADGLNEPIPSFYQEAGISPSRAYVNQHADEHIDPFTGKLQWHMTDLFIPGNGGLDIAVQRSYSSLGDYALYGDAAPEYSPAGFGWTMHFGRVMRGANVGLCSLGWWDAKKNPVVELPDGSRQILYEAIDGMGWVTTNFYRAECNLDGPGGLTIFAPDGTRYDMTTAGIPLGSPTHPVNTYYTSRITDRNGNWLAFEYGFPGQTFGVSKITSSDGRTVDFTYDGSGVVSTVKDDSGRTWTYTSVNSYLTQVTRPDGASWNFEYKPADGSPGYSSMSKVTYPTGGTISYDYAYVQFDSNNLLPHSPVISVKTTSDGTWSYAYKPATVQLPADQTLWTSFSDDQCDITTISGPDGIRRFRHIGLSSVPSGGVMHIGQPVDMTIADAKFQGTPVIYGEGFSHNIQLISYQQNSRPGNILVNDGYTYASIDWGHNRNRDGARYNTNFPSLDQYGNPVQILEEGTDKRTTDVSYYIDTGKWILHKKKDESITVDIPEGAGSVGQILRSFDGNGNLLSENHFGVATSYTYTAEGDVQTKTDARGNAILYGSYYRGIPQSESHPEGVHFARQVSGAGNVMSETDGENATTSWLYDGLDRPTKITHPAGNPVTVTWAPTTRTTVRGPYKEVLTYDAYGHEAQVVHSDTSGAQSIAITYKNDVLGQRVFTSYPNNASQGTYKFVDVLGQVRQILFRAGPTGGNALAGQTFNLLGNQIQFYNERVLMYTQTYRNFGNLGERLLMSVDAPDASASLTMQRNGAGQLKQVTQAGKTRNFAYDTRYFLTSQTDPETGPTTFGRDEVGNMTSKTVGAAAAINYGYDGRNRLATVTYADGDAVSHTYYKDDKVQSLSNGAATRNYVYDGNKNLTSESLTIGTQTFAVTRAYNANDALSSIAYSSGASVAYNPDGFGRATTATPYVTTIAYHPSGAISSMTYANGVQTNIGLNDRLWPSTLKIGKSSLVFDKEYFYDGVGNVNVINDYASNTGRQMTYDNIDRLVTATGPWNGLYKASYDGRGNITRQGWTNASNVEYFSRAYTYGAGNDLLTQLVENNNGSGTTYNYTYDARGNVTAKGALALGYTDASTMRCSNCATPAETAYAYDGANMRISTIKNGATTYFMYGAGGNLLWEQTPGATAKQYIYVGGKQVAMHEKSLAP